MSICLCSVLSIRLCFFIAMYTYVFSTRARHSDHQLQACLIASMSRMDGNLSFSSPHQCPLLPSLPRFPLLQPSLPRSWRFIQSFARCAKYGQTPPAYS